MRALSTDRLTKFFIKLDSKEVLISDPLGLRVRDAIFYKIHTVRVDYVERTIFFNPDALTDMHIKEGYMHLQFNRQTTVILHMEMIVEMNLIIAG